MQQELPLVPSSPSRATRKEDFVNSQTNSARTQPNASEGIHSTAAAEITHLSPPGYLLDRGLGKLRQTVERQNEHQQQQQQLLHPPEMISAGVNIVEKEETKRRGGAPRGLVGRGSSGGEEDSLELSLDLSNCTDEVSVAQTPGLMPY